MAGSEPWVWRAVVALALMASACGDDVAPSGGDVSGSRIRAMYFVDERGRRVPRGWFDRELGVPCAWTGGDEPLCLPTHPVVQPSAGFSDAACTQPVVRVLADPCFGGPPTYVAVWSERCEPRVVDEVWTVSDRPFTAATIFRPRETDGVCAASSVAPDAVYLAAGVRLDRDAFGHGRVFHAGRGRVLTRTIVSDDGARVALDGFDRELDSRCVLTEGVGCVPPSLSTTLAEDDACARPIAVMQDECPASYLARFGPGSMIDVVMRRGEPLPAAPGDAVGVQDTFDPATGEVGVCRPTTIELGDGQSLHRAGARVFLAPVARRRVLGGAVAPEWLESGEHREPAGVVIAALGVPCVPLSVGPDRWRCLPRVDGVPTGDFFADAACTRAIDVAVEPLDDPGRSALPAIGYEGRNACGQGGTARGYQTGELRAPGTTFVRVDSACRPAPTSTFEFEYRYRDVVGEASLDVFPALMPITE